MIFANFLVVNRRIKFISFNYGEHSGDYLCSQRINYQHFIFSFINFPQVVSFQLADGNDTMKEQIQLNYDRIKREALKIVSDEKQRIKNDPDLKDLFKEGKEQQ